MIVIAGSDAVAASLTHIFLELAHDPILLRTLQEQLDALPNLTHDNLVTVKFLDAVINETLRMYPPIPSGTQRVTPPEGLDIGEQHIPGNIIVQVPSYTIFRGKSHLTTVVQTRIVFNVFPRFSEECAKPQLNPADPRAFVQPNDFIPERWTTRPELILDKSVFIPFNTGKQLVDLCSSQAYSNITNRTVRLCWKALGIDGTKACSGRHHLTV